MPIHPNPGEISLTKHAVEKKAIKLQRLYMKRMKKLPGRQPDKATFIFFAAYSLFKEKNPKKRNFSTDLFQWLIEYFFEYYENNENSFYWKKLYKWMAGRPFKEMLWEGTWDDFRVAQKISNKIKNKGRIDQRNDIMRPYEITKKELEDLTPLILSQNLDNKKESNEFIFNQSDK